MARGWTDLRGEGFPEEFGPARSAAILDAVRNGDYLEPEWYPVVVVAGSLEAHYEISNPIRIGTPGDSIIPNVTMRTAQGIADLLGYYLPTPRLLDAAASQASCPMDFAALMGNPDDTSTERMEEQSNKIDALLANCPGLMVTPGKQWVLAAQYMNVKTLRHGKASAFNYGGYTRAPLGAGGKRPWRAIDTTQWRIWQPMADAHGVDDQADYSQVSPQLVRPEVVIVSRDNDAPPREMTVPEVAASPTLCKLWTHEGVPSVPHHPWISHGGTAPPITPPPTKPPPGGGEHPPIGPGGPPVVAAPVSAATIALTLAALGVAFYLIAKNT